MPTTPSRRFSPRATATVVALALLLVPAVASAAEPWERNPAFLDKREPVPQAAASQASGRDADGGLVAVARKQGSIRVLVELDVPSTAATAGSDAAASTALAAVQDAVIAATFGASPSATSAGAASEAGIRRYEIIPFLSLTVTPAELERLIADGRVLSIQEDVPAPPLLHDSIRIVRADKAQDASFNGRGFAVAVLDTGFDTKHPMLKGRIASEACFSTNARGVSKSLCPGGKSKAVGSGAARNCATSISGCDHGTHVASIAVGGSSRRTGVAPGADLVAIQIFSRFDKKENCGSRPAPCVLSYTSDQIAGLEHVYKQRKKDNIAAANFSLGAGAYEKACDKVVPAFTDIVRKLKDADVATVAAAGNSGLDKAISGPACVAAVIAVAASTDRDKVASYSNYGALIDVVAPGSEILAAVPGGYATLSGTSMATPHVAGAIAILREAAPSASFSDIQQALVETGKRVRRGDRSKPRIDVDAARKLLQAEAGS